jgi:uncharacterized protein (TIGR00266 family)
MIGTIGGINMTEEVAGGLPNFADSDGTGVQHRIIGTTMPVLEVQLQSGQSVISQGGELSWMSPTIQMTTQTSGAGGSGVLGVLKRAVAGGTIFMSQYTGGGEAGTVAFATKLPGNIMPVKIDTQNEYMVSRHGYLASTDGVTLNLGFQQKLGVGVFSGNGFILQRIAGNGTAWIELSGEIVTYELGAGESMLVHPGHIGLFEAKVALDIQMVKGIKNMFFGAESLFLAKLTGPGKVHLQTMTLPGLAHALQPYIPQGQGSSGGGGLGNLANLGLKLG